MEKENTDEIFSIKLNSEGVGHLLKFAKLVRFFLVISILVCIVIFVRNIVVLIERKSDYDDSFLTFYLSILPLLSIAAMIMFACQVFFYQKLNSSIQKAINQSDENGFNKAFKYLVRHAIYTIAVALFSLLFVFSDLFFIIKYRN